MTSSKIRQTFLDFFKSKQHKIVSSAPIVIKNDPTLMFTNAGMNQFKDYFLGNKQAPYKRVADTQKCLRVSGKHNDLEEVGVDTYHHTMFEMLGNWSFGDYFKAEAIAWSWELLTEVYKIDKARLYVTIFEGDQKEGLPKDDEALTEWKKWISEDRILMGNKKDNFWEMGDTGPCGPCTEIHVDSRSDEERKQIEGKSLVNADHPQVIEIWNNVFIQFNRLKNGSLEPLPQKHVDTGMGFERLVRVLQNKHSNYDTDVFTGTIAEIEKITNKKYDYSDSKEAVAFRVLSDHIRAISFTITDGQLPSNTGAGYVIRRILRRAVRYYYSYLDYKQPLLFQLVPIISKQFENVFPELNQQRDFVTKVIKEEEDAFLRTLEGGLKRFEKYLNSENFIFISLKEFFEANNIKIAQEYSLNNLRIDIFFTEHNIGIEIKRKASKEAEEQIKIFELKTGAKFYLITIEGFKEGKYHKEFFEEILKRELKGEIHNLIDGLTSFELNDTYGFPLDLTQLLAKENNIEVDVAGFNAEMQQQKKRSRAASAVDTEDWIIVSDNFSQNEFVGYDSLEIKTKIVKYRKVKSKGKEQYQVVLEATPFYAESGGQVGDVGVLAPLSTSGEGLGVRDTKKENNLIIHFTDSLPENITDDIIAKVDFNKRKSTEAHHSATHLLHAALRKVLGNHVQQKGSLVNAEHLRFDFSHFTKMTDEEIAKVEAIVNKKIRENIPVVIKQLPKDEALKLDAMALFGEKYGDVVRVVIIDPTYSVELCGGTHVGATGELGFFKIKTEITVAAGVRRIEAVSGEAAEKYVNTQLNELNNAKVQLNNVQELSKGIEILLNNQIELKKKLESTDAKLINALIPELLSKKKIVNGFPFVGEVVEITSADSLKKLRVELNKQLNGAVVLCASFGTRVEVPISFSQALVKKGLNAKKVIKEKIGPLINGGGDGSEYMASAGGKDASNFEKVIETVKTLLTSLEPDYDVF